MAPPLAAGGCGGVTRLLDRPTWLGLALTVGPLLLWGGVSVARLTHACAVTWWIAWIPAVATSGVMIAATKLAMTPTLDQRIRTYAGWLSAAGILADILAAGAQHWLEAQHRAPAPELAAVMGGLPSLMGGLLVHIVAMVVAQSRREREAAQAAAVELDELSRATALRSAERAAELAHAAALAEQAQARLAVEQELATAKADRVAMVEQATAPVLRLAAGGGRGRTAVPRGPASGRRSPVRDAAIRWLRERHEGGHDLASVGPSELATAIQASRETCKKGLPEWRSAVLAVAG